MAATAADVVILREMIGTTTKTDADLLAILDRTSFTDGTMNYNIAAATIWREKAANAADLVDVAESGSSRKLSDLRKNYVAEAEGYENAAALLLTSAGARPRTRSITRA